MYLCCLDESGVPENAQTSHFVFAGLATLSPHWKAVVERDPREITHGFGRQTVPDGCQVDNPAFDLTPASLK